MNNPFHNILKMIIDGHSHSHLETCMVVGDTLIVSDGQYGKHLGGVSITVSDTSVVSTDVEIAIIPVAE